MGNQSVKTVIDKNLKIDKINAKKVNLESTFISVDYWVVCMFHLWMKKQQHCWCFQWTL